MRLFMLELKRLLKSRRSLALIAFMVVFTIFLAWVPTTYLISNKPDGEQLTGMAALEYDKNLQQGIAGTVSAKDVQEALTTFQNVYARYGAETSFDLPDAAYAEVNAVQPLLTGLGDLYPDENGQPTSYLAIDPADVTSYYEAAPARIQSLLDMQYPNDPAPGNYFVKLYDKVETPFTYEAGVDSTALDYMVLLALVLLFCCALIAAPVFSSDYQTGADDIQRCTKNGCTRLGLTRVGVSLALCGVLSAFCLALYWFVSNSLYGWELLDMSVQLLPLLSPVTPLPFNLGEFQLLLSALALLTILASVCAILLLSSRLKNLVIATGGALLLCILPVIVYMVAPSASGITDWLLTLLPSSGVCMQACTLYAMRDFGFLQIGDFICWTPIAMSCCAAVELMLFAILAVTSYTHRHA